MLLLLLLLLLLLFLIYLFIYLLEWTRALNARRKLVSGEVAAAIVDSKDLLSVCGTVSVGMAHWRHHLQCLLMACLALVLAFMVLSPLVPASLLLLAVVSASLVRASLVSFSLVMCSLVWAPPVPSSLAVCSLVLPSFVPFCPDLSLPEVESLVEPKTEPTWAQVGLIFGPKSASGGLLGAPWGLLGALGRSWAAPGPSKDHAWAPLGLLLGALGPNMGPRWGQHGPNSGPIWSENRSPGAL